MHLCFENELPETRNRIWIQHDAAPSCTSADAIAWLNENCPDRWIGKGGPVEWPPRSPDLSPLDFFLWGCMKSRVYLNGKPATLQQLVMNINEAAVSIRNDLADIEWTRTMETRLRACVQARGRHFEQYI
ncbi:hypothetical protein WN55_01286 [Dufourea novaeangliae]|uniref:Transposable element Tc3 transposase n=1 Tax=Dufourea novaeangliae TaxID=178035 RepID=A0A154NWF2_DUFNO|nr:hypothetical protein WN55_01286 [Dufourea novaeangliae]